jgi:hypothetical protein
MHHNFEDRRSSLICNLRSFNTVGPTLYYMTYHLTYIWSSYYFIKWVTILRSSIALKAYYADYKNLIVDSTIQLSYMWPLAIFLIINLAVYKIIVSPNI